jgi:YkoY family integral membrane protein
MFGQTFGSQDIAVVALLVVLEGVLSIDNALVLGLLAKRLPKHQQKKALTYGLVGAFVFRFIAIGTAAYLLKWRIVKLFGGGYLVWVALKHFYDQWRERRAERIVVSEANEPTLVDESGQEITGENAEEEIRSRMPIPSPKFAGFWSTVFVIEMTDIAFAIDSILAAIALVGSAPAGHAGPHPKLWVVITGGFLGVILMRFAAVIFIRLLEKFPRFEVSAYLLVTVIGMKLLADWLANTPEHPHRLDFHSPQSPAFWVFWALMIACFALGFVKPKHTQTPESSRTPPPVEIR